MAPRPIWSGVISFGLVTVPVRLFSAVHEHKLQFHLVHEKDDGPIGYQKVCKLEDKPVADDEIVKAFEYKKGELVHLTDEDFEAVQVEGQHTIDLEDFVPYDEIDPTFFAHTYLVGPGDGAEKTYALLVRAMTESGLAGIGKFVMRNRQYLGCLRVRDKALTLEQLHFADEVDPPASDRAEPAAGRRRARARHGARADRGLLRQVAAEEVQGHLHRRAPKVIRAKQAGKEIHRAPEPEPEEPPDLFEALRESVRQQRGGKPAKRAPSRNGNGKVDACRARSSTRRRGSSASTAARR